MVNIKEGTNVVSFYDKDFLTGQDYEITISSLSFCTNPILVDIDNVFYCDDVVKLSFQLICMDYGNYLLELKVKATQEVVKKLNAIYTK